MFPLGLLSNRKDLTWGWGIYENMSLWPAGFSTWMEICFLEGTSASVEYSHYYMLIIYNTQVLFISLKKFTCIFESPFINFPPSIIVIYENLSWSGVWISPIRYFLIFSNSCLMLISSPFSICKKGKNYSSLLLLRVQEREAI